MRGSISISWLVSQSVDIQSNGQVKLAESVLQSPMYQSKLHTARRVACGYTVLWTAIESVKERRKTAGFKPAWLLVDQVCFSRTTSSCKAFIPTHPVKDSLLSEYCTHSHVGARQLFHAAAAPCRPQAQGRQSVAYTTLAGILTSVVEPGWIQHTSTQLPCQHRQPLCTRRRASITRWLTANSDPGDPFQAKGCSENSPRPSEAMV